MTGIVGYGAYLPARRVQRAEMGAGKGARVVASYDEDSTTMAVEAARRVLGGTAPGAIYLATTSPAYLDKTNAAAVHAALGVGHDGFAVDLAGSPRSGIAALKAAARGGLAVLSDVRSGRPGSADERDGGDGAAAFLFGDGDPVAEVVAEASMTAEILDRWRLPDERSGRQWEDRFGLEAYRPLVLEAARRALAAAGVEAADHVVVSCANPLVARSAWLPNTLQRSATGHAGAADAGLALVEALDRAAPGETVLLLSAVDGCDALLVRKLTAFASPAPVAEQLAGGTEVPYVTYLAWRGWLDREPPRRPEPDRPAGPPSARNEAWKFAFVGSRCVACGFVHLPPMRVCKGCGAVDRMEPAPRADATGTVGTYTVDRLAYSPSPPLIDVVVDFDGGGRCSLELADASAADVEVGTRVALTFRRLYTSGGVHNYFWKARISG